MIYGISKFEIYKTFEHYPEKYLYNGLLIEQDMKRMFAENEFFRVNNVSKYSITNNALNLFYKGLSNVTKVKIIRPLASEWDDLKAHENKLVYFKYHSEYTGTFEKEFLGIIMNVELHHKNARYYKDYITFTVKSKKPETYVEPPPVIC